MKEQGIGQQIAKKRKQLGLSRHDVAQFVNVTDSTIYRWESGEIGNMRRDRIAKLAHILKVSPLAIMGMRDFDDEDAASNDEKDTGGLKKVPRLGTIACGFPILAEENIEGWEYVPARYHADFALTAKGDSMVDARIYDGDIVFIRQVSDVDDGSIAAVLIDDEATLKKVYRSNGSLILSPANDKYPPMVFNGYDGRDISILGKAVAFQSSLR